jgi:hypothetical protein
LGIVNVQSRFLEVDVKPKEPVIEEVKPQPKKKDHLSKRQSSLAPMKSTSSTANFNRTTKEEEATS